MDEIENKIRKLYQEKKMEDEKSIPGFENFQTLADFSKLSKKPIFNWRIAASVTVFLIVVSFFMYRSHNNSLPVKNMHAISPSQADNVFPTGSLLELSSTTTYIWQWKAPTDKLLEGAKKIIKINSN